MNRQLNTVGVKPSSNKAASPGAVVARENISVREVSKDELELLLAWRMEVLGVVFEDDRPWSDDAMLNANRRYYERALGTTHRAFIASLNGEDVGCGGVCFQEEMPSPDNPPGRCAYLMNIYTRPVARGHGVAAAVVEALVEAAREYGAGKIYLEATDAGRPVYEQAGFTPLFGMMKLTEQ